MLNAIVARSSERRCGPKCPLPSYRREQLERAVGRLEGCGRKKENAWGMMAWRVRAAIIEDRMWALGGSRSPKRARHANWERAQCRQSEHFCGRGRGASSAGRSDYYQF